MAMFIRQWPTGQSSALAAIDFTIRTASSHPVSPVKNDSSLNHLTSLSCPASLLGADRIEPQQHGGNLGMVRLSLYVVGVSAFLAAWALYRNQQKTRPVPVKKAAEMLQEAWADYHTRA